MTGIILALWSSNSKLKDKVKRSEFEYSILKASTDKQLLALQNIANKQKEEVTKYANKVQKLEASEEQVNCDMPSFMRNAFTGM